MDFWYTAGMEYFALLLQLLQLLFPQTPTPDVPLVSYSAQVISVIDGDTIEVSYEGVRERVRYIGIDTPEPHTEATPECYSQEATARNEALVAGKTIRLEVDQEDIDRYDRKLRYVYVDEVFVNEALLAEGYASTLRIPPNDKYVDSFAAAAKAAQSAGYGLWSACQ